MMKKYLLPVISAILLLMILLSMPGRDSFRLGAGEILDMIDPGENIIQAEQLEVLNDNDDIVLVDLSSQEDYNTSSLPGARNLPLEELNVKTIHELFSGPGNYVLYSADLSTTCKAWILLTQMGYKNIFVLDTN